MSVVVGMSVAAGMIGPADRVAAWLAQLGRPRRGPAAEACAAAERAFGEGVARRRAGASLETVRALAPETRAFALEGAGLVDGLEGLGDGRGGTGDGWERAGDGRAGDGRGGDERAGGMGGLDDRLDGRAGPGRASLVAGAGAGAGASGTLHERGGPVTAGHAVADGGARLGGLLGGRVGGRDARAGPGGASLVGADGLSPNGQRAGPGMASLVAADGDGLSPIERAFVVFGLGIARAVVGAPCPEGGPLADGFGFGDALLRPHRIPDAPPGPVARDIGVGRGLWFLQAGTVPRLRATIAACAPERHAALWEGVGMAAVFTGGGPPDRIARLVAAAEGGLGGGRAEGVVVGMRENAAGGAHGAAVLAGASLAVALRAAFGRAAAETDPSVVAAGLPPGAE